MQKWQVKKPGIPSVLQASYRLLQVSYSKAYPKATSPSTVAAPAAAGWLGGLALSKATIVPKAKPWKPQILANRPAHL